MQVDAEGARVMLIDLADTVAGIPICRGHARTRTAPIGWTLEDLRTVEQPPLWTDRPHDDDETFVPMIERSTTVAPIQHGPEIRPPQRRAEDQPTNVTAPTRAPYFEFRRSEDLSGPPVSVTSASSPLLSRAFRSVD
jgi:hypothetical protein